MAEARSVPEVPDVRDAPAGPAQGPVEGPAHGPVRVLVIDDDEDDFVLVRDLLGEGLKQAFDAEWARDFDMGLKATCDGRYDLVLVDYRLGSRDGLELVRSCVAGGCRTPLILLTGQDDREVDVEATRAGAADYLVKGQLTAALLERSVRYALERARNLRALLHSQEQLRQAQKLEAVGRLAGGVAHDFNNLLTAITGHAELLLGRLHEADPLREDAEQIRKAAGRAAALTRRLLTFSRKHAVQSVVLDLNAVVADMHKMLGRMIGEDVELRTALSPGALPVRADRGQLEQVLMNLAVNARDAMPGGGVLTISTSATRAAGGGAGGDAGPLPRPLPPGRYAVLSVADTGCGMDAETRSRVFEPFFTTKDPDQGTGLGLATVYGIVRQGGGDVAVQSAPGEGAVFTIHWPLADEPAESPPAPAPRPPAPRPCTVLVVEDQDVIRVLVRRLLRAQGFTVLEARDGEEALSVLQGQEEPIDLLLSDVVMPRMSGPQLAEQVLARRPGTHVLFMSGYASTDAWERGAAAHAAFIEKPFTLDQLLAKVREVLDAPGRRAGGSIP